MIDETDRQIIRLLEQDARRSNRDVARQIGASESTVRTRIRKLQNSCAIRFTLVTDPRTEGMNCRAFVRLKVSLKSVAAVVQNLTAREETAMVAATTGRFNVIAFVLARNDVEMRKIVSDDLSNLKGVLSIDVRLCVQGLKYDHHLIRVIPQPDGDVVQT